MKGVYFKTSGLEKEQLKEMQDIMVEAGGEIVYDEYTEIRGYNYCGVDPDAEVRVYDESGPYGADSVRVEPTPEALREALGLPPKPLKENTRISAAKLILQQTRKYGTMEVLEIDINEALQLCRELEEAKGNSSSFILRMHTDKSGAIYEIVLSDNSEVECLGIEKLTGF